MHQILPVMVARFNRGMSLRPVNRIKHVVDFQGGIAAGAGLNVVLIDTTDTPTLADTNGVETGSKVNSIYLVVEVSRTGTTSDVLANVYFSLGKNPGGNLTLPEANVVGVNDNKKYIIHQEMVMLQGFNASNPRTLFKGVINIPRGYRRNGPNDTLVLRLQTPGVAINVCLQCHYKEFR